MRVHKNVEIHTLTIWVDNNLLSDAAKAVVPDLIRSLIEQLRAKAGFVSTDAIRIEAVTGSFNVTGDFLEEFILLREEVTHEDG